MNWLEELEKKELKLIGELEVVKEQIYRAKLEKHGINIGCIVMYKGNYAKVTRAEVTFKKPWLWGVFKNKNGEWSVKESCLCSDWEPVK